VPGGSPSSETLGTVEESHALVLCNATAGGAGSTLFLVGKVVRAYGFLRSGDAAGAYGDPEREGDAD
jgi:hypothetical protein